jgi:predicted transcriptional regulator
VARDARYRPLKAGVRRIDGEFHGPRQRPYILSQRSAITEVLMSANSTRQKILEAIEKLPADATLEDAIERLVLLAKIERGLAELDAGHGIDHDEAKRRLLR